MKVQANDLLLLVQALQADGKDIASVFNRICTALDTATAGTAPDGTNKRIFVTGHSLGGSQTLPGCKTVIAPFSAAQSKTGCTVDLGI